MRYLLLTVYDSAVEAYSPPMCVRALGQGLRDFIQECNSEKSRIFQSPEHFSLFELGHFDDSSGQFDLHTAPRLVARAHEHKTTGV